MVSMNAYLTLSRWGCRGGFVKSLKTGGHGRGRIKSVVSAHAHGHSTTGLFGTPVFRFFMLGVRNCKLTCFIKSPCKLWGTCKVPSSYP